MHGATLDLTFGPSAGHGSAHPYWDNAVPTAALTLMPSHGSSLPVAFTIGVMPQFASSLVCRLQPGGGCAPRWPALAYLGVLGGVDRTLSFVDYRALVGPVLVASSRGAAGGQLLLNAAAGSRHVALVVGARGSYAVRFDRERVRFGSVEVGARIR